jgi:hypothetical protein
MMPTDRPSIPSVIFDSNANEMKMAADMLTKPAMAVVSKMELSVGSI